jgi:hypothetical protein
MLYNFEATDGCRLLKKHIRERSACRLLNITVCDDYFRSIFQDRYTLLFGNGMFPYLNPAIPMILL